MLNNKVNKDMLINYINNKELNKNITLDMLLDLAEEYLKIGEYTEIYGKPLIKLNIRKSKLNFDIDVITKIAYNTYCFNNFYLEVL